MTEIQKEIIRSSRFIFWQIMIMCGGALLGLISIGVRATAGYSITSTDWIRIASFSCMGAYVVAMLEMISEMIIEWVYLLGWRSAVINRAAPLTRESWERRRGQIKRRDRAVCRYCGNYVPVGHVDHIIPLSRGGTDDPNNLVWACPTCNLSKGNQTWQEWRDGNDS